MRENNIRDKRAEYFKEINEYISKLPDEEFDKLLIECGIEKCPYEDSIPKNPMQVIISEFAEDIMTLDQAEFKIKELLISEIDKRRFVGLVFDKSDSFLAGMSECTKIIENLWRYRL